MLLIKNFFANAIANALSPLLSLILVPFYLKYLGLEAYGLIGFYTLLITVLGIFTKGAGTAFLRELSCRGEGEKRRTQRSLVRTFEISYWVVGLILSVVLALMSNLVAHRWIITHTVSTETVQVCMLLIALRTALTLPNIIYQASYNATQRQVFGNVLVMGTMLFGNVLSVIVVMVWKSVVLFYVVDVVNSVLSLIILRYFLYARVLPAAAESDAVGFSMDEVRKLWRISAGLMWINGTALIFLQLDRWFISKLLPLETLGLYTIAAAAGRLVNMACAPFFTAIYPQSCQVAETGGEVNFSKHLVRNVKVIAVLCLAAVLPTAYFSSDLIEVWTRSRELNQRGAGDVMRIYVYGNGLIALASVFYVGQKALGELRFMGRAGLAAVVWYPLVLWFLIKNWGLQGAAIAYVVYAAVELTVAAGTTLFILLRRTLSLWIPLLGSLVLHVGVCVALIWGGRIFADNFIGQPGWRLIFAGGMGVILLAGGYVIQFGWGIPGPKMRLTEWGKP